MLYFFWSATHRIPAKDLKMLRKSLLSLIVVSLAAAATSAQEEPVYYESGSQASSGKAGCDASDDCDASCDTCCQKCKHRAKKQSWRWASCNCNGSYKFPVPPLYTYHWPGLYSHRLMTDYHSPWRFPAIRPYPGDEQPGDELSERRKSVRQVSQSAPRPIRDNVWQRGSEPVSAKIERLYR